MEDIAIIGKVGILSGGPSSEKEISIKSGDAVFKALISIGIDAVIIDVTSEALLRQALKSNGIDIAFIALHGKFGEDGNVQSLLCEEGICYTGSGPEASRLALDKALSKEIFKANSITTPDCVVLKKEAFKGFSINKVSFPCVIKPCNEGSSIGMNVADAHESIMPAIKEAFNYDDKIIIEDYVEGIDITVGILDDKPLPVVSIQPKDRFYTYHSKYTNGASEYRVPADLSKAISHKAQSLGMQAHKVLGCESFSRVDMIYDSSRDIITVLEVNTIPGFTSTSLLPKAAKAAGIDFPDMCLIMLKHAVKKELKEKGKAINSWQKEIKNV
jgi:D-alanine-D-alanine ligase